MNGYFGRGISLAGCIQVSRWCGFEVYRIGIAELSPSRSLRPAGDRTPDPSRESDSYSAGRPHRISPA